MQVGYISLRAFGREHGVRLSAVQKAIKSGRVTDVLRSDRGFAVGIHSVNAWVEWMRNTDPGEAAKSGKVIGPIATVGAENLANVMTAAPSGGASRPGQDGRGSNGEQIDVPAAGDLPMYNPPPKDPADLPERSTVSGYQEGRPAAPGPSEGELPLDEPSVQKPSEKGYQEHRTKREMFLSQQAELDYLAAIGALVSVADVERETEDIFSQLKSGIFRIIPKKSAILAAETDPARIERLLMDALTQAFNETSQSLADGPAAGVEERSPALS